MPCKKSKRTQLYITFGEYADADVAAHLPLLRLAIGHAAMIDEARESTHVLSIDNTASVECHLIESGLLSPRLLKQPSTRLLYGDQFAAVFADKGILRAVCSFVDAQNQVSKSNAPFEVARRRAGPIRGRR